MDGRVNLRRSFLEAVAFGLLVTGVCYIPPLELAPRVERWLYDVWTRLGASDAPSDILLVRLEDPVWFETLAELARQQGAKALISTLPHPPSPAAATHAAGPVEVPVGGTRLRRTDWTHGGHLWFEPDLDGVIRHERPSIDDGQLTPSLASYAAGRLAKTPGSAEGTILSEADRGADGAGRRWLRFYAGPFAEVTPRELLEDPGLLTDKVLIAGRTTERLRTPIGELTPRELLAHAVTGYRRGEYIEAGAMSRAAGWVGAALVLLLMGLRPPQSRRAVWALPTCAAAGLIATAGVAFVAAGVWLAAAGPAAWLLTSGGLMAARLAPAAPASGPAPDDAALVRARRAAASGRLEEAWLLYRQVPPSGALLAELYDLASALERSGDAARAADLFHRIAQVDSQFRDVAQRLVRSAQPATPAARPVDRSEMPPTLGRYQLLEPIGRGAMGCVYLARDPMINRIVALKVFDLAADFDAADLETASHRFLREAETAGRLSHPNIVTIFDVGESGGLGYLAMEYLKGRRLSEFTAPDRLLPVRTVLELLSRTADALDYAHAQNVVHRDIKPANIMYDSISDGLKITDFGIARLIDVSRTRTGIVLGTPAFMSPEQLEGKNVNGHTDLFALGVSLYELLTGHLPFRGASMTKLMFVIANEPHPSVTTVRTDLPEWLDSIIDKALAKDPADRFQTGAEMAAALRYGAAQAA
jgi:serine/threonine-protein kinase